MIIKEISSNRISVMLNEPELLARNIDINSCGYNSPEIQEVIKEVISSYKGFFSVKNPSEICLYVELIPVDPVLMIYISPSDDEVGNIPEIDPNLVGFNSKVEIHYPIDLGEILQSDNSNDFTNNIENQFKTIDKDAEDYNSEKEAYSPYEYLDFDKDKTDSSSNIDRYASNLSMLEEQVDEAIKKYIDEAKKDIKEIKEYENYLYSILSMSTLSVKMAIKDLIIQVFDKKLDVSEEDFFWLDDLTMLEINYLESCSNMGSKLGYDEKDILSPIDVDDISDIIDEPLLISVLKDASEPNISLLLEEIDRVALLKREEYLLYNLYLILSRAEGEIGIKYRELLNSMKLDRSSYVIRRDIMDKLYDNKIKDKNKKKIKKKSSSKKEKDSIGEATNLQDDKPKKEKKKSSSKEFDQYLDCLNDFTNELEKIIEELDEYEDFDIDEYMKTGKVDDVYTSFAKLLSDSKNLIQNEMRETLLYGFNDYEELIHACKLLRDISIYESILYTWRGHYYLLIVTDTVMAKKGSISSQNLKNVINILKEFGYNYLGVEVIREFCNSKPRVLISKDAIKQIVKELT